MSYQNQNKVIQQVFSSTQFEVRDSAIVAKAVFVTYDEIPEVSWSIALMALKITQPVWNWSPHNMHGGVTSTEILTAGD